MTTARYIAKHLNRILICAGFLLLILAKTVVVLVDVSKPASKEISTQEDNESEKSSDGNTSLDKELAYQNFNYLIFATQVVAVKHFTVYQNAYIPSHFTAVQLQPPKNC